MLKYEDEECFPRGGKKHLEDQNYSSNKGEENDFSRIDFLGKYFRGKRYSRSKKKLESSCEGIFCCNSNGRFIIFIF